MNESTLESLRKLTSEVQKIVAAVKDQQEVLLRERRTFRDTQFHKPAGELATRMKATLEKCKQELLAEVKQFHAEQTARLEQLKVEAAKRATSTAHFRDSNHGLDETTIQALIDGILSLPTHPTARPPDSAELWRDLDQM